MHDPLPQDEDRRLETLFREGAPPVADDGFTQAVMRRVSRLAWRRRLVLAVAGAAGIAVAAEPLWELSLRLSHELIQLTPVLQNPLAIAAGVLVLAAPAILKWLEE